jgi:adenylate cyclase
MPSAEEFANAGLYNPAEHATNGRLELLDWLDEQGFTIDEMVEALNTDRLGALPGDRRLLPGERMPREQAIAVSGLNPDRFDDFVRAFGLVSAEIDPAADVEFTTAELETVAIFATLAEMFSTDEAASFVRVLGAAMGRIAEAAVSLFLTDVESPMLAAGDTELDLARKVYDGVGSLDGLITALDPILRRHVLQAIQRSRRSVIAVNERFQYRYAVGFVDLVGLTEISGKMDPRDLADFIRDFEGRSHDIVTGLGARVVKLIGDEVMFVSTDANSACQAASALMAGFETGDERVVPRGGLAFGPVLVRGGDYYGSVVNLASRLVDEAVPGELLVTSDVTAAACDCSFEPAGRRMVKGFADPVPVSSYVGVEIAST